MRFLFNDIIPYTTLSSISGAIVSELPLTNLKKLSKAKVTRSVSGGTLTIGGDLISPANISSFIIGLHNFTAGTIYQLELLDYAGIPIPYDNDGAKIVSSSQEASSPKIFQYNLAIWTFNSGIPVLGVNSFILTIYNPSASYFQIGRLMAGEAVSPRIGVSYGHNLYWKENSNQYRTEAGTLRTDVLTPSKVLEFNLDTIYESERSNIQRALASLGKRDEFYISLFPENCLETRELDYSGIVKMTSIPRYPEFANNLYGSKYTVEEI